MPQLNHVTKGRAKAPKHHRRGNKTKPITGSKTVRPAGHRTKVLADMDDTARPHRCAVIKGPKEKATTSRCPGNNIRDLRAKFERLSSQEK